MSTSSWAAVAVLSLALWTGGGVPAHADVNHYEFRLLESELTQGDAVVAVQLVHRASSAPVPDAVIFATRLDMAPDGMATMAAPLQPLPSTEPGVYRFRADLGMAGGWRLSLAAKLQGETGTLENRLMLRVLP